MLTIYTSKYNLGNRERVTSSTNYLHKTRNLVSTTKEIKEKLGGRNIEREPSLFFVTRAKSNWNRNKNTWGTNNNCGVMHVDCAQEIRRSRTKKRQSRIRKRGTRASMEEKIWLRQACIIGWNIINYNNETNLQWIDATLFLKSSLFAVSLFSVWWQLTE